MLYRHIVHYVHGCISGKGISILCKIRIALVDWHRCCLRQQIGCEGIGVFRSYLGASNCKGLFTQLVLDTESIERVAVEAHFIELRNNLHVSILLRGVVKLNRMTLQLCVLQGELNTVGRNVLAHYQKLTPPLGIA